MCGRYAVTLPPDAMAQMFAAQPVNDLPDVPNYNVCPTVPVFTVSLVDGQRRLAPMRWGFLPKWYKTPTDGPLLINARSETLAEKPAFREACRTRRCLIPASGFYEWTKDDQGKRFPWYLTRINGAPMVFAGVWQDWQFGGSDLLRTCAIVTTSASAPLQAIHKRMPVILEPQDWPLWLGEEGKGAARLMRAAPDDAVQFHRVGTEVNSNRASGPELIEPFED